MLLSPSEIRFTQDSINNVFDKRSRHPRVHIGDTLDKLLKGQSSVSDIPTIGVVRKENLWYTVDNRRLWVFRQLEELGKCTEISVRQDDSIPSWKFTTNNQGQSVRVRGPPGGYYWRTCRRSASAVSHMRTSHQSPRTPSTSSPLVSTSVLRIGFESVTPDSVDDQYPGTRVTTPAWTRSPWSSPIPPFKLQSDITYLDPEVVRYTKDTIRSPPPNNTYRHAEPIDVYRAFDELWAMDGNRRLWSYKMARHRGLHSRVPAKVKDDEDEFLEKMRADRPWLSLLDILQMGESVAIE